MADLIEALRTRGDIERLGDGGLRFHGAAARLYRWLDERCGIKPVKAKEVYRVGRVAEADAELIQLATNTPAFEVERIAYDSRGPFEYTLSTMRADRYEIRSTLYI